MRLKESAENRKALPKNHITPKVPSFKPDKIDLEVFELVDTEFSDHPGQSLDFWSPTDRKTNGKIERLNGTVKNEAIRPNASTS